MKTVEWRFESLVVPMIDIEGKLYCTSKGIYTALGVDKKSFSKCFLRHQRDIGAPLGRQNDDLSLGCQNVTLRSFLLANKSFFDIKRVKGDIQLWSSYQMFEFSVRLTSPIATKYRRELWELVERHAQVTYISQDRWEALEARNEELEATVSTLVHQMGIIMQEREAAKTSIDQAASAAGRSLSAFRQTKPFRTNRTIISV